jgi:hypothetical protein
MPTTRNRPVNMQARDDNSANSLERKSENLSARASQPQGASALTTEDKPGTKTCAKRRWSYYV